MRIASEVPLNVMYIAINGKIYKHSMASKQCLIEFQSYATLDMHLYDYDDKLISADQEQLRLWDFQGGKADVPQLVTVLEAPLRIECVKVNKFAEPDGEREGVYYYVIAAKDEFRVYRGRLELLFVGDIENRTDSITSIEFGLETKSLYLGTLKGLVHKFELPSPSEVRKEYAKPANGEPPRARRAGGPFVAEEKKDYDYAVSIMHRVHGVLEEDFFVMHVKHAGIKLCNYDA